MDHDHIVARSSEAERDCIGRLKFNEEIVHSHILGDT